jgi:hypothetical protein
VEILVCVAKDIGSTLLRNIIWRKEMIITREYLRANPKHIFVFGDNDQRSGKGGAAILRDEPNTYGFITKKAPNHSGSAFYRPEEYITIYKREINLLKKKISENPDCTFLITKIGAGLANKYHIWEEVIKIYIKTDLEGFDNVKYLFPDKG